MPVFILLVFLAAALVWVLSSYYFIPLGKLWKQIWGDAKDAMSWDEENEENDEKGNEK
jgi:hypothetical protein